MKKLDTEFLTKSIFTSFFFFGFYQMGSFGKKRQNKKKTEIIRTWTNVT